MLDTDVLQSRQSRALPTSAVTQDGLGISGFTAPCHLVGHVLTVPPRDFCFPSWVIIASVDQSESG